MFALSRAVALASIIACPAGCTHQSHAIDAAASVNGVDRADQYRQWEREIPQDTKLYKLKLALEKQSDLLPERDLEDRTPLPMWFRILMRKQNPNLRTSGTYQYPRPSTSVLERMLKNPDGPDIDRLLAAESR